MQPTLKFSDFEPSKTEEQATSKYRTHIVWEDVDWDWKPLTIEVSNTWNNLRRRARGEA